jgi:DNA-directed RNA polymerase beta' subunit
MPGMNRNCEDDLTYAYQQILKQNNLLRTQMEKGAGYSVIEEIRKTV